MGAIVSFVDGASYHSQHCKANGGFPSITITDTSNKLESVQQVCYKTEDFRFHSKL